MRFFWDMIGTLVIIEHTKHLGLRGAFLNYRTNQET